MYQRVGAQRRWGVIAFCSAALVVPVTAWSDRGAEGEGAKSEVQEKADMASAAKVTIHDAIKAATEKVSGKVIEAELETKPRASWEVEVLTDDGKLMEVWVDIQTGAVVAAEEKKPEREDEQHKKTAKERKREHRGAGEGGMMRHGGQHPPQEP